MDNLILDRLGRRSHWVVAALVISAVLFVMFFDFFTKGYVLDAAYDRRDYVVPYHMVFQQAFHRGEVPSWNPYIFCGTNIFSSSLQVFFYPPNWITWAFPASALTVSMTAMIAIHVFLAGMFAYMLLFEIIQDAYWALCGMLAYLLSSTLTFGIMADTHLYLIFVYLPLVLYLTLTDQRRSLASNICLHAAALSLLLLGGPVHQIIYVLGFSFLFALVQGIRLTDRFERYDPRPLLAITAGFIAALLVSAVRYLPFFYALKSNAMSKTTYEEFLRRGVTPVGALLKVFLSDFFIGLNKGEYFNSYAGICTAFFALYGLMFIWDRKTFFWKACVVLITLTVIGTPLSYLHYVLTGRGGLAFGRLALLLPLCSAVLFGLAGKTIMEDARHRRRMLVTIAAVFAGVLVWALVYYLRPGALYAGDAAYEKTAMLFSLVFFTVLSAMLAWLLLFLQSAAGRQRTGRFKALLLLLLLADLLIMFSRDANSQNPFLMPRPYYTTSRDEQELAAESRRSGNNFRIFGLSQGTRDNRGIHASLLNSTGYDNVPPYYVHLLYAYPTVIPREDARQLKPMTTRALELAATRYVVEDDVVFILPSNLARYALYSEYKVIDNDDEALQYLADTGPGAVDLRRTVVLHDVPDPLPGPEQPGSLKILQEGLNDMLFEASSAGNTILLLNDSFDPGWRTFVDGREASIIRANFAFRAVALPAGRHQVRFLFIPRGYELGKRVSLAASALLVLLAVVLLLLRFRRRACVRLP